MSDWQIVLLGLSLYVAIMILGGSLLLKMEGKRDERTR